MVRSAAALLAPDGQSEVTRNWGRICLKRISRSRRSPKPGGKTARTCSADNLPMEILSFGGVHVGAQASQRF
jgi:hypothetical protein